MTYPFVYYEGCKTPESMLEEVLDDDVDVEAFSSPNGQGFHVQLPIIYKGIDMGAYTAEEQHTLKVFATYLRNPAAFTREKDAKNLPCFVPPTKLEDPYCIVPVRTGEDAMLTKIYLPKIFSADPGGVFSLVIKNDDNIFFIYHKGVGEVC